MDETSTSAHADVTIYTDEEWRNSITAKLRTFYLTIGEFYAIRESVTGYRGPDHNNGRGRRGDTSLLQGTEVQRQ